jgi:hypothetical protein
MDAVPGPPSPRSEVKRLPERARYDRATVHAILDEGLVAHVGIVADGAPVVIPTAYVRMGDWLYLHGSPASRLLRALARGARACVTVTLLDGLVLARSAFHHSMNYRSVVVFGRARLVRDLDEKRRALEALVEHVVPGRSRDARAPNAFELEFTRLVALPLDEASAKVRTGGPRDDPEDMALPAWAGELPFRPVAGTPRPDAALAPGRAAPDYLTRYRRPAGRPPE